LNILISTTTHWNPGDDFIREGIFNLLPELRRHNVQYHDRSPRVPEKHFERNAAWCDLYIHAGTPDWLHKHDAEYRLLQELDKPYAFIGVGNPGGNQRFELYKNWLVPTLTSPLCLAVIVRDPSTSAVLTEWGIPHEHLPCPAYFLFPEEYPYPFRCSLIGLGCYGFNQGNHLPNSEAEAYFSFFRRLETDLLKRGEQVVCICHTHEEYLAVRKILQSPCFLSDRWEDYLPVYASLKCYVGSRVHGAIAAASALVPAFHLGIDQRLPTCDGFPIIRNTPWSDGHIEKLLSFVRMATLCQDTHRIGEGKDHKRKTNKSYEVALFSVRKFLEGS
jgi:hypothetical protein